MGTDHLAFSRALSAKLANVQPSRDGMLEYRPCAVRLGDGLIVPRVVFAMADPWFTAWGIWPEDDPGKVAIAPADVADLWESPARLPAHLADELYRHGESGMGFYLFRLWPRDGSSLATRTGNVVDFPYLPAGTDMDVVERVEPAGRSEESVHDAPPFAWCLLR